MRAVYKYTFDDFRLDVELPRDHMVVLVGRQNGALCIWIDLVTTDPKALTRFYIAGTGHTVQEDSIHVGSFQDAPFVWHVYVEAS